MSNNKNDLYLVLTIWIIALVAFFAFKGCDDKSEITASETREMKAGTPDTVFVKGDPDTVYFSRVYERIVKVPVEKIVNYGKDSSKTDTTVNLENGTLTLGLTTYPAIDSLKLDIDLLTVDREIFRVDTLKILQVDTLNITKEIYIEPAWYETWWFGSLLTTVVGITAIILGK